MLLDSYLKDGSKNMLLVAYKSYFFIKSLTQSFTSKCIVYFIQNRGNINVNIALLNLGTVWEKSKPY
jgi:hypothetical protein